jgi:hypothetical protein
MTFRTYPTKSGKKVLAEAKSYTDTVVDAIGGLTYDGSTVLLAQGSGNPDGWRDVDVSSIVGSNRAMLFLKVKLIDDQHGQEYIKFRTNGETDQVELNTAQMLNASISTANEFSMHCVITDDSGVFEYYEYEDDWTIILLAYLVFAA